MCTKMLFSSLLSQKIPITDISCYDVGLIQYFEHNEKRFMGANTFETILSDII